MNDDVGVLQVVKQFIGDGRKLGLVFQKLGGDAVNLQGFLVAVATGIEVKMFVVAGEFSVE